MTSGGPNNSTKNAYWLSAIKYYTERRRECDLYTYQDGVCPVIRVLASKLYDICTDVDRQVFIWPFMRRLVGTAASEALTKRRLLYAVNAVVRKFLPRALDACALHCRAGQLRSLGSIVDGETAAVAAITIASSMSDVIGAADAECVDSRTAYMTFSSACAALCAVGATYDVTKYNIVEFADAAADAVGHVAENDRESRRLLFDLILRLCEIGHIRRKPRPSISDDRSGDTTEVMDLQGVEPEKVTERVVTKRSWVTAIKRFLWPDYL